MPVRSRPQTWQPTVWGGLPGRRGPAAASGWADGSGCAVSMTLDALQTAPTARGQNCQPSGLVHPPQGPSALSTSRRTYRRCKERVLRRYRRALLCPVGLASFFRSPRSFALYASPPLGLDPALPRERSLRTPTSAHTCSGACLRRRTYPKTLAPAATQTRSFPWQRTCIDEISHVICNGCRVPAYSLRCWRGTVHSQRHPPGHVTPAECLAGTLPPPMAHRPARGSDSNK